MTETKQRIIKTRDGSFQAIEGTSTQWSVWYTRVDSTSLGDIIYSEKDGMVWFEPRKVIYSQDAMANIVYLMSKCFRQP
jgi:hypothetical protein